MRCSLCVVTDYKCCFIALVVRLCCMIHISLPFLKEGKKQSDNNATFYIRYMYVIVSYFFRESCFTHPACIFLFSRFMLGLKM